MRAIGAVVSVFLCLFDSCCEQGAIAVSEVPRFADTRKRLLRMSYQLAHQPDSVLRTLEHPTSLYNAGWSKGKEKIGNVPDELKGSFYANPLHDRVGLFTDSHPFFYPDNIWPTRVRLPKLESNRHQNRLIYLPFFFLRPCPIWNRVSRIWEGRCLEQLFCWRVRLTAIAPLRLNRTKKEDWKTNCAIRKKSREDCSIIIRRKMRQFRSSKEIGSAGTTTRVNSICHFLFFFF